MREADGSIEGRRNVTGRGDRDEVLRRLAEAGLTIPVGDQLEGPVLTTGQAAAILRCSDRTVRKWADDGKLVAFRTLGGRRLFPASSVLAAVELMRSGGVSDPNPREVPDARTSP
jgi:excisionase family DNA binding protein